MHIVTNRITVPTESVTAFEEQFRSNMRTHLAGVPGLRRATLQRPEAEGLPYITTMEFDTKEAFQAWIRSDSFRNSHAPDAPKVTSQNVIEQHTLLEEVTA